MIIPNWYIERKDFIEEAIQAFLEKNLENNKETCLENFKEALFYATQGGKKLRSILALEFFLTITQKELKTIQPDDDIILYCIALELIHAYSLVHDDLPCMDNDTLRRGKPTVWKKYGEWQATLIWDNLQTLAFQAISEIKNPKISVQLSNLLSKSSGFSGIIWWQVMDLFFEENPKNISAKSLVQLHNKKTWALIKASIQGAVLVSEKLDFLHKLTPLGEKLGLAFQIKDDILDVEWSIEATGKSIGGEEKGFVYFMGLEKAKSELQTLTNECFDAIRILKSEKIHFLVKYVAKREG